MVPGRRHAAAAGQHARRLLICSALVAIAVMTPGRTALAGSAAVRRVDVTEAGGVYKVTAAFAVTESPEDVVAVLTDYERIPKYMPDIEVSKVLERTASGALIEQEAVSKFMLFSKRVHLLLEVREGEGIVSFVDRCRKSFGVYEGAWVITRHDSLTVIDYQLNAKPSFEVPGFVLRRLLKRDAAQLIDRIAAEIAARAMRGR